LKSIKENNPIVAQRSILKKRQPREEEKVEATLKIEDEEDIRIKLG